MNIVAKKNWVYRVYETELGFVISVPFGSGSVDYSRAFKIDLESLDEDYLTQKAKDIVENYESYKVFEVTHP